VKSNSTRKIALAGILIAIAVVGSMLSFPVLGSKCSPVQHAVNVIGAVLLGPWYNVAAAFLASLIRNLTGLGSPLAFPGSMCGALLSGLAWRALRKVIPTACAEIVGTGIIGGLAAWPVAKLFMQGAAANAAFYAYIVPFLISTVVGSVLAAVLVLALQRAGVLEKLAAQ